MLDPNTATFQTTDDSATNTRILVGQLGATQAFTIDRRELFKLDPEKQQEMTNKLKMTLAVAIWRQVYGELGGIIEHLYRLASESGDLRYLSALQDARALLRPEVSTPALAKAEDSLNAEAAETQREETHAVRVAQLEEEIAAAHRALDGTAIRDEHDGYPEGRPSKKLSLIERIKVARQMLDDYETWLHGAEAEPNGVIKCMRLIRSCMGGGAGAEEIALVIEDRIAAEAVLSEGEYEGADGIADVVKWLRVDRDAARDALRKLDGIYREGLDQSPPRPEWLTSALGEDAASS